MTSSVSREGPEDGSSLGLLRAAALIAVLAAGSVGLMLRAGHRNDSRLLLILFAVWVLSPFVALLFVNVVSKRWSVHTRAILYIPMLVLTLSSLAMYGNIALAAPRGEDGFGIPCTFPGIMAADGNSPPDRRVNIRQVVTPR